MRSITAFPSDMYKILSPRYLTAAYATVVIFIVNHAELSRSNAVYRAFRMYGKLSVPGSLQLRRMIFGRVADLECDMDRSRLTPRIAREEMEIVYRKIFLIRHLRVITLTYIEYVAFHIFFDSVPRTATEAKSVPLTYGVEPQPPVHTDLLARFKFEHVARILTKITSYIIVIVNLPKETNSLTVSPLCIDKMLASGNFTHFIFHIMTYWKEGFT